MPSLQPQAGLLIPDPIAMEALDVRTYDPAVPAETLDALERVFPASHVEELLRQGFPFYRCTFWLPIDRAATNVFETIVDCLKSHARPSARVTGVEWWLSVLPINATPQWILPCHFDRNDLTEKKLSAVRYPEKGSVLFLSSAPYGELVVTDQVQTEKGIEPKQPKTMVFVAPRRNRYAVFPGRLYHGVLGRLWRPRQPDLLRISMAVNWWDEKPRAPYLRDSRECVTTLQLRA